jgi:hypothetical protein
MHGAKKCNALRFLKFSSIWVVSPVRVFSMGKITLILVSIFLVSFQALAEPVVGRGAATGYMGKAPVSEEKLSYVGSRNHYLALHLGKLVNAESWKWGKNSKSKNVGSATVGVTYRVKEWMDTTDFLIRIDFNEYDIDGKKPQKLSFLPMILFPEASSEFPLYFGAGLGLGVFFKQLDAESSLALDYQLIVGIRFFDVFENVGLFLESGLKNHIQLTDDGQVNSSFISTGALFTF